MDSLRRLCRVSCGVVVAIVAGCATAAPHAHCDVGGEVLARTGHDLGPRKSSSATVLSGWVDWDDGLSEEEAIAVGLANNAAFQELLADLDMTQADIVEASQLQNPQMNTMLPVGPKQWEFALLVPLDVLWLRPLRVSAAQLEAQRVAQRLTQDGLNVVRDIRIAYIDWQLALARAALVEQGAKLRNEIAQIAEARLAAGAVAELDVTPMRLDAAFAKAETTRAVRDVELALARLRFVLGVQQTEAPLVPVHMSDLPGMEFESEELVSEAINSRPDLLAVQLAVHAAEERAELARHDIWRLTPMLPDLNSRGKKGFEAGPGLQMTVPIFHQNQGAVARAEADAERFRRQLASRRDLAILEVQQAHTQLLQAWQDLETWRGSVVPQAQEASSQARKALEEDGVPLLLVLETTRQLLAAQERELQADAELRRAAAELERSVGRRLFRSAASDETGLQDHRQTPVALKEET